MNMQINKELGNLPFDLPKNKSNVIKVIGIGGGGSNAINYMYLKGIKGVGKLSYLIKGSSSPSSKASSIRVIVVLT